MTQLRGRQQASRGLSRLFIAPIVFASLCCTCMAAEISFKTSTEMVDIKLSPINEYQGANRFANQNYKNNEDNLLQMLLKSLYNLYSTACSVYNYPNMPRPYARTTFESFPHNVTTRLKNAPILVAVHSRQYAYWHNYFANKQLLDTTTFHVVQPTQSSLVHSGDHDLDSCNPFSSDRAYVDACKHPKARTKEELTSHDIWICDSDVPLEKPRLVTCNNVLLFYPSTRQARDVEFEALIPNNFEKLVNMPATPLFELNVLVDNDFLLPGNKYWTDWVKVINNRIVDHRSADWPCLVQAPRLDVRVTDLERAFEHKNNSYFVRSKLIQQRLTDLGNNVSHVLFYIPQKVPLRVTTDAGKTSIRTQTQNGYFQILPLSTKDRSMFEVFGWMLSQCMTLPEDAGSFFEYYGDNTFPSFYAEIWAHRIMATKFQEVVHTLVKHRNQMLNLHATVEISQDVTKEYEEIVKSLVTAKSCAYNSSVVCILTNVDRAKALLDTWDVKPPLLRPVDDFPPDRFAAFCEPVILYVAFLFIAVFVREIKIKQRWQRVKLD